MPTDRDLGPPSGGVAERLRRAGERLARGLRDVLDDLPGAPHRPSQLAREVGTNRAVASRLLTALKSDDPLEMLHRVPGPEPLRKLVRGAQEKGAGDERAEAAISAIDAFDQLIREEAGTRPALDALISASLPGARERFELASKYSVFKGLAQLKGARAEHWIGAAIVAPAADSPTQHDLTFLNGAVAMQRLRPGVTVRFSYREQLTRTSDEPKSEDLPALGVLPLDEFCTNPPARLEARPLGKNVHYYLPDDLLGPREIVDMFVVDHHPAAIGRYSPVGEPRKTSLFVEPALPVANLVFDVLMHRDAFPGAAPSLAVYDTGYEGLVDVNDPSRDIDRMPLDESIEILPSPFTKLRAEGVPNYGRMLAHLAGRFGWDPDEFRCFRTTIAYPVFGWQVCLVFDRPQPPA